MQILKTLPVTPKEYFSLYKERAYTELVGVSDLKAVIGELRLAYKKYPEKHQRILNMVGILKVGLNTPLPKYVNRPIPNKYKKFVNIVKSKLF